MNYSNTKFRKEKNKEEKNAQGQKHLAAREKRAPPPHEATKWRREASAGGRASDEGARRAPRTWFLVGAHELQS